MEYKPVRWGQNINICLSEEDSMLIFTCRRRTAR
jgi:hypothetical protein